jgi:hypothetical protein
MNSPLTQLGRCDAKAGSVALSIVDDRCAVRSETSQELRAEAVKAGNGELAFSSLQSLQSRQELLQAADRAIDPPMPQRHLTALMMWNQLIMWAVGFGMARGSRFRISAPFEITVTSPKPQYPSR